MSSQRLAHEIHIEFSPSEYSDDPEFSDMLEYSDCLEEFASLRFFYQNQILIQKKLLFIGYSPIYSARLNYAQKNKPKGKMQRSYLLLLPLLFKSVRSFEMILPLFYSSFYSFFFRRYSLASFFCRNPAALLHSSS